MIDIPDERVTKLQQIITQAVEDCETPGDTIKQLADKLPNTEEFGAAVFMLGKMSSVGRTDIIVNATMMMLGGMPITEGLDVITTLYVNTLKVVNNPEALVQYVETTKRILDELIPKPIDVRLN